MKARFQIRTLLGTLCLLGIQVQLFVTEESEIVFDSYHNMSDLENLHDICNDYTSEECAIKWLGEVNRVSKRNHNRLSNIEYEYSTNINKKNEDLKEKFDIQAIEIHSKWKKKLRKFKWRNFFSPEVRRTFQLLTPTISSENQTVSKRIAYIDNEIGSIYNLGRPCFDVCLKEGETEISSLFQNERNYDRLKGFWAAWRNETGRKLKKLFTERMNLENIGAKENGYADAASFYLQYQFEEDNFKETVTHIYEGIKPLYVQLHAYVRYCLGKYYPDRFNASGPIPAHILGNVFAQQWQNIMPILQECGRKFSSKRINVEVNENLKDFPIERMFKMAEEFYTSIGMYPMTKTFWERSVIKQVPGRLINCHGSAYDFSNSEDFRILMCTLQNSNDFTTIYHEMGHIQYYMAYRHLNEVFKGSPNPGFHEAIGDTIALSVKTPEHLKKVGLIAAVPNSEDFDIDYLLSTALEKVAFLPYALSMETFVWNVYNGSVPHNIMNQHWWDLRLRYQGLKPPIPRTEDDFDPASKYHVAFGISYIRYFISFILQFQLYESMCKLSGHTGPLHRCDFYQSKEAGIKMLKMLEKGNSQHWKYTLKILTGENQISSSSLLLFFKPLQKWLEDTNKRLKVPIGW